MPNQTIEDHIIQTLSGEAQGQALSLAEFIRAQGMHLEREGGYWEDKRYWLVKYKNNYLCFILVNGYGDYRHPDEPEGLIIWSSDNDGDCFASASLSKPIKQTAWQNIDFCGHCGYCGGGTTKTLFGKAFDNVCRTTFRFDNPNAEAIDCLKNIIKIHKNSIF